ncbi:MAG: hypothetical protein WA003_09345 [Desulfuromonadaceae bacterium]
MLETAGKGVVIVFFIALFFTLTVPVSDPDFWWHLASGKWMWLNGAIIQGDPFIIDSQFKTPSISEIFILKQYWLSQIVFYLIYQFSGFKGIVLLTATVHAMMFFFVYKLIIDEGVTRLVAIFLLGISWMVIVHEFNYIGSKPQMWSSLFSVVIVYILENMKKGRRWASVVLPPLMLVWANLHGGFIFGNVIIVIYCAGLFFSSRHNRSFYVVSAASILLSGVNPNGFTAFISAPLIGPIISLFNIQSLQGIREVADSISETQSIFQHSSLAGIFRSLHFFAAIISISLISFAINIRNMRSFRIEHLLLFVAVLFMGARSIRFIIFFTLIASFLAAINLKNFWERYAKGNVTVSRRWSAQAAVVLILAMAVYLVSAGNVRAALASDKFFVSDFENGAEFILRNNLRGNIFNDYNGGGYLIWRLTPDIKLFIDGRNLYPKIFEAYQAAVDYAFEYRNYERVLDDFNIDMVMMPGCDKVSGTLITLVAALLEDHSWSLLYADASMLVFMRNSPENMEQVKRLAVPKEQAYQNIYNLAINASLSGHASRMPNWKLSVAYACQGLGDNLRAVDMLREYINERPDDKFAASLLKRLEP